jgi:hypothetical protein
VALKTAVDPAEGAEFAVGNEAAFGKGGVEDGGGVAFAEDEAVAVRVGGGVGVDAQDGEIEGDEDVGGGEGAAGVAGFGAGDHLEDAAADGLGPVGQFGNFFGCELGHMYLLRKDNTQTAHFMPAVFPAWAGHTLRAADLLAAQRLTRK